MLGLVFVLAFATAEECSVGDVKCMSCKTIVSSIEKFVASNKTETIIVENVEKLCTLLPDSYEPVCDRVVEVGVPTIINWVTKKIEPERICQRLRLCPSNNATDPLALEALGYMLDNSAFAFAKLPEMTAEKLKNRLFDICEAVPVPEHYSLCRTIVSRMNFAMVINQAKLNPRRDNDFDFCENCKVLVDYFKGWVKSNVASGLKDKANAFCAKLGTALGGLCKSVINSTWDKLKDLINEKQEAFSSYNVCVAISFCE